VLPATLLALLVVFLPRLIRYVPGLAPDDVHTDLIMRVQASLFTMTSLVLTFTLVQADINFRRAEAVVSSEAARIDQLDRLLTRYGDAGVREIRPLLRAYTRAIVDREWPAMLNEQGNEDTAKAFAPVSRRVLAIDPPTARQALILGEMLKSLDAIAESRATRLSMVAVGLPSIYWQVALFALATLIFVSCMVWRTPMRTIVLAAQAAVVGAFLGFVFIMDQPFKGNTAVGPHAIVQTIARIDARSE
jgi:hypothetical protein